MRDLAERGLVDALQDARRAGGERRLRLDEGGDAVLAPWLHLGGFAFTS